MHKDTEPERMFFSADEYDVSVVSPEQYAEVVVEVFGAAGTVFFLTDEDRSGSFVVELVDNNQTVLHRVRLDVFMTLLNRATRQLKDIDKPGNRES